MEDEIVKTMLENCIQNHDTALFLNYMNLKEIPKSLLKIKILKRLYLKRNLLTTVPKEISVLGALVSLYLDSNMIEVIPQSIGCLSCLESLELNRNELNELPTSIGNLANLKSLHLSNKNLMVLPKEVGRLTNLQTLNLMNNQLETLPREISGCVNLVTLQLDGNKLKYLCIEILHLNSLQDLSASRNDLRFLPDLHHIESLTDLTFDANVNLQYLPGSIALCAGLKYLGLHNCLQAETSRKDRGRILDFAEMLDIKWIGSEDNKVIPLKDICLGEVKKALVAIDDVNLPCDLEEILKCPLGSCIVCDKLLYRAMFMFEKTPKQVLRYCQQHAMQNESMINVVSSIPDGFKFVFSFCSYRCLNFYTLIFESNG